MLLELNQCFKNKLGIAFVLCQVIFKPPMDTVSQKRRSEIMSRVRSKHTKPEWTVRRLIFGMGYRYRLHDRTLPGNPDIIFRTRKKVIFVHGCFWHRHENCALARLPKSRVEFWTQKLENNRRRDLRNQQALISDGWRVLTVWECELVDPVVLQEKVRQFLEAPTPIPEAARVL
jgi:DNA mismatch endonuclease (patch repair protein)